MNMIFEALQRENKKIIKEGKQLDVNAPEYEGLSNSEVVEQITGLDMFEQRDAILKVLDERFDASNLIEIETMNVESVEEQDDGSLKVTYDIYGRPVALYEKVTVVLPHDNSKNEAKSVTEASYTSISPEHKEVVKKVIESQKLFFSNAPDILDSYEEGEEFVVKLDNSNPTYIADLEKDLDKLEDEYDIGFEKESNGNGFYAYSYRFFYYKD